MSIEKARPKKRENTIKKFPGSNLYMVRNRKTGQVHSYHATLANAEAQRRLIEANPKFVVYK